MKTKAGRILKKKVKAKKKQNGGNSVTKNIKVVESNRTLAEGIEEGNESRYEGDIPDVDVAQVSSNTDGETSDVEEDVMKGKKHLAELQKLKEKDPEFFKFLETEDPDLLDFEASDESDDDAQDEDTYEDEEEQEKIGEIVVPRAKKDEKGRLILDGNILDFLEEQLTESAEKKSYSLPLIRLTVDAFQACVARVGADMDPPKYIINEQKVFDAVVRFCFVHLGDALILMTRAGTVAPSNLHSKRRSENLKKYQPLIKKYLNGIMLFLNEVQSPNVIVFTLKAVHRMMPIVAQLTKISRSLVKILVRIWTQKTIECRMIAFLCMNELVKVDPTQFSNVYKSCYMAFVSTSRQVSEESWPLLQFVHRTYAELTLSNAVSAYPYAFVYIRQTAIHLRNALISKKRKDLVQTVYNWQFMQCLYLWVQVVSRAYSVSGADVICELNYPLTQIIIGVSRLHNSSRYLPLRIHCVSLLIQLQATAVTHIPTMALATEVFEELVHLLKKKPKISKVVVKGVDITSQIKVNHIQVEEPAWRQAACQHLFRIMLQAAHTMSSQPSFPDLFQPIIFNLRHLIKSIRSPDHSRLFKGLVDKLQDHSTFIQEKLKTRNLDLQDEMSIRACKFALNDPNSPLRAFYRQWERIWKLKESQEKNTNEKEVEKPKVKKDLRKKEVVIEEKPKLLPKKSKKKTVNTADLQGIDTVTDLASWSDDE